MNKGLVDHLFNKAIIMLRAKQAHQSWGAIGLCNANLQATP